MSNEINPSEQVLKILMDCGLDCLLPGQLGSIKKAMEISYDNGYVKGYEDATSLAVTEIQKYHLIIKQ